MILILTAGRRVTTVRHTDIGPGGEQIPAVLARWRPLFGRRLQHRHLSVAERQDPSASRMTIVHAGRRPDVGTDHQQLNKLIDVIKVTDFTARTSCARAGPGAGARQRRKPRGALGIVESFAATSSMSAPVPTRLKPRGPEQDRGAPRNPPAARHQGGRAAPAGGHSPRPRRAAPEKHRHVCVSRLRAKGCRSSSPPSPLRAVFALLVAAGGGVRWCSHCSSHGFFRDPVRSGDPRRIRRDDRLACRGR